MRKSEQKLKESYEALGLKRSTAAEFSFQTFFTEGMLIQLEEIFRDLCAKWRCELLEFGGEADHVHLLFEGRPNLKLSVFVDNLEDSPLKEASARVRSRDQETLPGEASFWRRSY